MLTGQWGDVLAQFGQFRAALRTLQQAAGQAGEAKAPDARAMFLLTAAFAGWPVDQCQEPEAAVKLALAADKSKPTQIGAAATYAFCGKAKPALALELLEKKYPDDTLVQQLYVPQSRAYLALQAGDGQKAVDLLVKSQAFDQTSPGAYLRGLAYLQLHDAGSAAAAFKIATRFKGPSYVNVRGTPFPANYYALGLLGLGRAYAMAGDKANAKAAYEKFFKEWKDAEPGLPMMAQAKKEYTAL
jgi:tetratricopeptide (TPR) repeat protein